MKSLLTGGSGKLGIELQKHLDCIVPSREDFDITKYNSFVSCDLIIHAAAYTDVQKAESFRWNCFETNVIGTFNLVEQYKDVPFVFISTEYAKHPENFYSFTKSLAEQIVMNHPNYLIIRTLFKPRPWPFEYAYKDQWTLGDYVDVIGQKVAEEIKKWDKTSQMVYVGTGRKTMFELAHQTRPDVKQNSIKDSPVRIPGDYR